MNENKKVADIRLFLTAKQIERVRRGRMVKVFRAGLTYIIGKKTTSNQEFRIKARIKSWQARLKEVKKNDNS